MQKRSGACSALDAWHGNLFFLRQHLKGWNIRKSGEEKKMKAALLMQLEDLDKQAKISALTSEEWNSRYTIEDKLEHIYQMEEIYWQQRGDETWLLKGDSNTQFFHQFTNGRRRKNLIRSLEGEGWDLTSQQDIEKHVVDFYKNLFGSGTHGGLSLTQLFWSERDKLPEDKSALLIRPFQEGDVKAAIFEMKSASAPGPNGFGVHFFKTFWPVIKRDYMALFADLYKRELDIRRLNYGVITLVPKIKEANNIKQYKPICLLNVDYKGITKVLTNRFSTVVQD